MPFHWVDFVGVGGHILALQYYTLAVDWGGSNRLGIKYPCSWLGWVRFAI